MTFKFSPTTANHYLSKIFRFVFIHVWTFLVAAFSLPRGRKIFFGFLAIIFFCLLVGFLEPYVLALFRKMFLNPDLALYNECIFGVIEKAPVDEEFSWRLSACGEAPSRFKWSF